VVDVILSDSNEFNHDMPSAFETNDFRMIEEYDEW
jgi:hypothetical protein